MKRLIISAALLAATLLASAQGIRFFEGSYDEALAEATAKQKLLFIDFYADWCGPCKQMAKEVFTDSLIGVYFNEKFIALQINTEKKENKEVVKKYKVNAMPTLAFLRPDGKIVSILSGARGQEDFLKMAQIAAGDALSFEDLYNKYKSHPEDLTNTQALLKEAPGYVGSLEGIEIQKWTVRVNKIYKDYVNRKIALDTALINTEDYNICYKFNPVEKDNPYLEYVNSHIDAYMKKLGNAPAAYVIEYNNKIIEQLAKDGDANYKKYLDRIGGDMKTAYSIAPVGKISTYEKFKYYYDGLYILYHDKDVNTYLSHTQKYLDALGDQASASEYGQATQNMYYATKGKLPEEAHEQGQKWLVQALQYPKIPLVDKINLLTMLGDSRKASGKHKEAREAYNQAYMESLQVTQKMTAMSLQMTIKRKLGALEIAD